MAGWGHLPGAAERQRAGRRRRAAGAQWRRRLTDDDRAEAGDQALLAALEAVLAVHGLLWRGGFHPSAADGAPEDAATVLMVGNAGAALWHRFAPHQDDGRDPLDRWTEGVLRPIATRFRARAVFPFEGPPYYPFQRWAMRAEPVHPAPIGVLIHPEFGLWHAYRAALLFRRRLELPAADPRPSPCASCRDRPCLSSCPIGAFDGRDYDVAGCRAHLDAESGGRCMAEGCLARRACPVGRDYAYGAAQAAFHMAAFADAPKKDARRSAGREWSREARKSDCGSNHRTKRIP